MRPIKFRAWSKTKNEMLHPGDVAVMPMSEGVSPLAISGEAIRIRPDNEDFVLMQLTGLKDKNGVEIYEGDILKPVNPPSIKKHNREVQYVEGSFCYRLSGNNYPNHWSNLTRGKCKLFEVIGNVYENPELLATKGEDK